MYMVKFDAPGIHDYIFGEDVLKQVRGASALVDHLSRNVAEQLAGNAEIVYLGGGGGAILFADQAQAQVFTQALAHAYGQQAPGLAFKCEGLAFDPGQKKLYDVMQDLDTALQQGSISGQLGSVLPGYLMPCSSCRQQPAVQKVYQRRLCASCLTKFDFLGKRSDHERAFLKAFAAFIQELSGEKGQAWRTVLDYMSRATQAEINSETSERTAWETVLPATLMDIGELAHRSGYFAMIYADGNRMGNAIQQRLQQGSNEPAAYREFSEQLVKIMEHATFNALIETVPLSRTKLPGATHAMSTPLREFTSQQMVEKYQKEPETRYILPFEILLLGGDDLVLMLPPELALPFSLSLQKHFKSEVKRQFGQEKESAIHHMSLGVGMVIAPYTTPIRRLFVNAEALLNSAKRKAFEMEKSEQDFAGALDWLTLVSDSNHDLEVYRREHFEVGASEQSSAARLTQRPLSFAEGQKFQSLIDHVLRLDELPLGPLQALVESCRESIQKGNINLLYLLGRLDEKPRGALSWLINMFNPAQTNVLEPRDLKRQHLEDNEQLLPFYQTRAGQPPQTGLLDLQELLPFYAAKKEERV